MKKKAKLYSISIPCLSIRNQVSPCSLGPVWHVVTTFGLQVRQANHPFSPTIGSTNLLFNRSLLDLADSDLLLWLVTGFSWGVLVADVISTTRLTMVSTSLILGRTFGYFTRHRLATAASFWAVFIEKLPSSFGSNIMRNFFTSDKWGLTQSKSFCSFLGLFRSKGRLPVMSS